LVTVHDFIQAVLLTGMNVLYHIITLEMTQVGSTDECF